MELNRCFFIGNLTFDPETRSTGSGHTVTTFRIAVNNRRGGESSALFLKVETWGKTAEIADKYLQKGSQCLVDGRLKIEEYTTKEGEKRTQVCVVADRLELGSRPKEVQQQGGQHSAPQQQQEDRVPF